MRTFLNKFILIVVLFDVSISLAQTKLIKVSTNQTTAFDWQVNMPWIGDILLGLLTIVANLLINYRASKILQKTTDKHINNAKDIAYTQIENSIKIVQLNFNKTVLSGIDNYG